MQFFLSFLLSRAVVAQDEFHPLCQCELENEHWAQWAEYAACTQRAKVPAPTFSGANYIVDQQLGAMFSEPEKVFERSKACPGGALAAMAVVAAVYEPHDQAEHQFAGIVRAGTQILWEYGNNAQFIPCSQWHKGNELSIWPWDINAQAFAQRVQRLQRKFINLEMLNNGAEPPTEREKNEMESSLFSFEDKSKLKVGTFCGCILYFSGAQTIQNTLESYESSGFLELAEQTFIVFRSWNKNTTDKTPPDPKVSCFHEELAEQYNLTVIDGKRRSPLLLPLLDRKHAAGAEAFMLCAEQCQADYIIFLEEDWDLISRPKSLVRHRLDAAMSAMEHGGADFVNLRHKLHFGAPYYEMLTATQHNEPPTATLALYYHEDPVAANFPRGSWREPYFSDDYCDTQRVAWSDVLAYQRKENSDNIIPHPVEWCYNSSSVTCASSLAEADPFRVLFYTTNPVLYKREKWIQHFGSYAFMLQDIRTLEEVITTSYMWRIKPGFKVGSSMGLFKHNRLDRAPLPEDYEPVSCDVRNLPNDVTSTKDKVEYRTTDINGMKIVYEVS
eukprot:gene423-693_t